MKTLNNINKSNNKLLAISKIKKKQHLMMNRKRQVSTNSQLKDIQKKLLIILVEAVLLQIKTQNKTNHSLCLTL